MQPGELKDLFPLAASWIYRIPQLPARYKLKDVYEELKAGNWQLWIFMDKSVEGVLLTTVVQYPLCRELQLIGIAGRRMKEWIGKMDIIYEFARNSDCNKVVMIGARRGFAKLFSDYENNRVVLEKEL